MVSGNIEIPAEFVVSVTVTFASVIGNVDISVVVSGTVGTPTLPAIAVAVVVATAVP